MESVFDDDARRKDCPYKMFAYKLPLDTKCKGRGCMAWNGSIKGTCNLLVKGWPLPNSQE